MSPDGVAKLINVNVLDLNIKSEFMGVFTILYTDKK